MRQVLTTIGLFFAGVIAAILLLFQAAIELIEFILSIVAWGIIIGIGWLVYQFKVR